MNHKSMFVTGQVLNREPGKDFPQVHLLLTTHQALRLIHDLSRRLLKREKSKFVVSFYGTIQNDDFRNDVSRLSVVDVEGQGSKE